jgi:hypothetical protein
MPTGADRNVWSQEVESVLHISVVGESGEDIPVPCSMHEFMIMICMRKHPFSMKRSTYYSDQVFAGHPHQRQ